jgi:hypothetical protein
VRLTQETESTSIKCKTNSVMYKNEFSCYFFNSAGSLILHLFIYIFFKLLLLSIVYVCLKGRLTEYDSKYKAKNKPETKSLQNGEKIEMVKNQN